MMHIDRTDQEYEAMVRREARGELRTMIIAGILSSVAAVGVCAIVNTLTGWTRIAIALGIAAWLAVHWLIGASR